VARRTPAIFRPARTDSAAPAAPADAAVALADLSPGRRATVVGTVAGASPATARRLADLGFTTGTTVEVVRRAPLRDPVIYRLRDYEVCLRRAQASCVLAREIA
jgi:ferrous iron transport protein A